MSTIFYHRKRKSYYSRSYIPTNLRQLLHGRLELWRSLETADQDEASVRAAQWDSRIKRVFVTLKKEGRHMTQAQIDALVEHWLESALDKAEDCRATCGPLSDNQLESQIDGLSIMFDETSEALLSCDYRKVEREADELLRSAGLPALDHNGAEFGRLCRRLLQAKIEYTRIETDRWEGKEPYKRSNRVAAPVAERVLTPAVKSSPLFSVVVKSYLNENPKAVRTLPQIQVEFEKFKACIGGDRPIASITNADGRTYKDHLMNERKVALATVIKHLSILSGLFRWCERQGFIPDGGNPVKGLAPDKKAAKKQATQRRPFIDEELLKVFGSKDFIAQKTANPARYWLCLLCLFTVARREEIGQLMLSDISVDDGIPFLRITDEGPDQALKNEGSKRRIPIHSALVRLGFLGYVENLREAGHVRLFPQLEKGANGFSDAVGKWFSRVVTKCGLTDPALVLHSLRHGGITRLHAAGVPHSTVEILAGHASNSVHGQTYVHRDQLPLSLLREGLEKLRYEEVMKALTT